MQGTPDFNFHISLCKRFFENFMLLQIAVFEILQSLKPTIQSPINFHTELSEIEKVITGGRGMTSI